MGTRNADRIPRLSSLRTPPPGRVWMAVCRQCGHMASMPVAILVERYGEAYPIETALWRLRCARCDAVGRTEHVLMRLCDPGCPRQR